MEPVAGHFCDVCGKSYSTTGSLNRHKRSHGGSETSRFSCGICEQSFDRSDVLGRHIKTVHGVESAPATEKAHVCLMCPKAYCDRKSLLRHVRSQHPDEAAEGEGVEGEENDGNIGNVQDVKRPRMLCPHCGNSYSTTGSLNKHLRAKHSDKEFFEDGMHCPRCEDSFPSVGSLTSHLKGSHNYVDDVEELHFVSMDECMIWKEQMQHEKVCSFVKHWGPQEVSSGTRHYFFCHRSGQFHSRSEKMDRVRRAESVKMGATCPARVVVTESENGVDVTWHKNHVGHSCNIKFLRLTATERQMLEKKLRDGVSMRKILDEVRDSVLEQDDSVSFSRLHMVERRDLWNLMRKIGVRGERAHPVDAVSVDMIVKDLQSKGTKSPVLFYKPQGQVCCPCRYQLAKEDFMLVLSTPYQLEALTKFLSDKVLMDSTHGTNAYDFQLTTLMTVDECGAGVPVAFCISNRTDFLHMANFLTVLKNRLGSRINANVFMSDMARSYLNAWQAVMGPVEHPLQCNWHVERAWRTNLGKVKGEAKKVEVYRACRVLMSILDVELFRVCLEGFLEMLIQDEDTREYGEYFSKEYKGTCEMWAFCFRVGLGLNTNMFLEAMHKKLKYLYLDKKCVRRLDDSLSAVLRLARDVAFERLIRKCKGNNSYRQQHISSSHKRSLEEGTLNKIIVIEPDQKWEVASNQPALQGHRYVVQEKADNSCLGNCGLVCTMCRACVHQYSCECEDHSIRGNMCKHIHACVSSMRMLPHGTELDNDLVQHIDDEIEMVVANVSQAGHVGSSVQPASMWQSISTNIATLMQRKDVNQAVLDGGMRFLELLRRELPPEESPGDEDVDVPMDELSIGTPTRGRPSAHASPHCSPTMTFLCTPPRTPTNRSLTSQRNLSFRSTKVRRVLSEKACPSLSRPTLAQTGGYIRNFLGADRDGILNVHTDGDHTY